MHRPGGRAVETRDETFPRMGERDALAGEGQADLTRMEMPREDQIERPGRDSSDDPREVAEEDP